MTIVLGVDIRGRKVRAPIFMQTPMIPPHCLRAGGDVAIMADDVDVR
jgi:hypothetical protein